MDKFHLVLMLFNVYLDVFLYFDKLSCSDLNSFFYRNQLITGTKPMKEKNSERVIDQIISY